MSKYRVIAKMYNRSNIYGEFWNDVKQYLQKRISFCGISYWRTIDEEDVPSFAWIHRACFGDETNWKSKFSEIPNCEFVKSQ